jgi:hypothetical protein
MAELALQHVELMRGLARLALGVTPFIVKRNISLDGSAFVGMRQAEARIQRLQRRLKGCVEIHPTSAC